MDKRVKFGAALVCAMLAAACASSKTKQPAPKAEAKPAPTAEAHDHHLHNVITVIPGVISGSGPESPEALQEVQAMGVRTIISVDGAAPDAETARQLGMRYVHVPVTYATITDEQRLEIARAIRDLPGPVYMHCHHGKHRGPSAAASAAITLGKMTPEQGLVFIKNAGTAEAYKGLYACVRNAEPASAAVMDRAPSDFEPVHKPTGLVNAMVEVDAAWENIGFVRKAGWTVPKDHPDLVPAAEAGRLADHFRTGGQSEESRNLGADFMKRLTEANTLATQLETALVEKAAPEKLEPMWAAIEASCKSCHTAYRN